MQLKTRVFDLYVSRYRDLSELARAMGIAESQVYRVRQGTRSIHGKFIIGAVKAFPGYKLDDLFYIVPDGSDVRSLGMSPERRRQILKGNPTLQKPDLQSKVILMPRDVAQLIGVHTNTVRRWDKKGILKSYRIGSRGDRRFRREDVERFLKEREIE